MWPKENSKSKPLFERAKKVIPGGVSRGIFAQNPFPVYMEYGAGARLYDFDGFERIDFNNNFTSLIHGHAFPPIVEAVRKRAGQGSALGFASEEEILLAEQIVARSKNIDMVKFSNSGTEGVMAALKAARAKTNRWKIAKCEGLYHGSHEIVETSMASSPENWGPSADPAKTIYCDGTPKAMLDQVLILPLNDIPNTTRILKANAKDLAGVILDLAPQRAGFNLVEKAYVKCLRDLTSEMGALLIYDEVISYRLGFGGVQDYFDEVPDLTAMGKIIGGGYPVGAVSGKAEIMEFAFNYKDQRVPVSGTFSGNPVTMAAGAAAMKHFNKDKVAHIDKLGDLARKNMNALFAKEGINAQASGCYSILQLNFRQNKIRNFRDWFQEDARGTALTVWVRNELLKNGISLGIGLMACMNSVMTEGDINSFVSALSVVLKAGKTSEFSDLIYK